LSWLKFLHAVIFSLSEHETTAELAFFNRFSTNLKQTLMYWYFQVAEQQPPGRHPARPVELTEEVEGIVSHLAASVVRLLSILLVHWHLPTVIVVWISVLASHLCQHLCCHAVYF
jgi:hypothetical protein